MQVHRSGSSSSTQLMSLLRVSLLLLLLFSGHTSAYRDENWETRLQRDYKPYNECNFKTGKPTSKKNQYKELQYMCMLSGSDTCEGEYKEVTGAKYLENYDDQQAAWDYLPMCKTVFSEGRVVFLDSDKKKVASLCSCTSGGATTFINLKMPVAEGKFLSTCQSIAENELKLADVVCQGFPKSHAVRDAPSAANWFVPGQFTLDTHSDKRCQWGGESCHVDSAGLYGAFCPYADEVNIDRTWTDSKTCQKKLCESQEVCACVSPCAPKGDRQKIFIVAQPFDNQKSGCEKLVKDFFKKKHAWENCDATCYTSEECDDFWP